MTRSQTAVLIGEQQPSTSSVPTCVSSDGLAAVELAEAAGLHLDPWQQLVLEESLGYRADGKWSALEVGLLVPRQNGKGAILEARELAGLFLFGERLIMHSAHEFKTAQEAFLRILSLIEDNPDFKKKVRRVHTAHGKEGIELVTGQRLRFVARSKGSGRGFTGDTVILDEAYAVTAQMMAALMSTMSARPNPQLWHVSSAGDETSRQLAKVRARGHAGADRLAFFEWAADEDADRTDPRVWAVANPGMGIRIEEEFVAAEFNMLEPDDFDRERLGIWKDQAADQIFPFEVWNRVVSAHAAPTDDLRLALDVAPDRSTAAIVASGGGVCELVAHGRGTGWVVGWLTSEDRDDAIVEATVRIDAGGPAGSLADDLEREGVDVDRMSSAQVATATARMYDAIADGRVTFRQHDAFDDAVDGLAKKVFGDRFVWSRSDSDNDVTPLVAATLAYQPGEPSVTPFAMWGG